MKYYTARSLLGRIAVHLCLRALSHEGRAFVALMSMASVMRQNRRREDLGL